MSIFEQSKIDAQNILTNTNDFGQSLVLKTKDGSDSVDLVGFHTKHHTAFDLDGAMINSKNASIAVAEKDLIAAGYPYRNSSQDVDLINHLADVKDSSEIIKNYIVREIFPDEYLGIIVLILGEYETV